MNEVILKQVLALTSRHVIASSVFRFGATIMSSNFAHYKEKYHQFLRFPVSRTVGKTYFYLQIMAK
jgi:hypothetical protein